MNVTSPSICPDHKKLLSFAAGHGVSELHVREFLWEINAISDLHLIVHIAEKIRDALLEVEAVSPHILFCSPYNKWLTITEFIIEYRVALAAIIGPHILDADKSKPQKSKHPLFGKGLIRNPLYCSLVNGHETDTYDSLYQHLRVHILLGHAKLMRDHTSLEEYESFAGNNSILGSRNSSVQESCKLFRDLGAYTKVADLMRLEEKVLLKAYRQELAPLPLIYNTNLVFGVYLADKHYNSKNESQYDTTIKLGRLFGYVYSGIDPNDRSGGGGNRGRFKFVNHDGFTHLSPTLSKLPLYFEYPDDAEENAINITQMRGHVDLSKYENIDMSISEVGTGNDTYLVSSGKADTRPYLTRVLAARGAIRHITMANQLHLSRWSGGTLWEITQLVTHCSDKFRSVIQNQSSEPGGRLVLETIVLIMIMLWTGSTLKRALKTKILSKNDIDNSELLYISDQHDWRLHNNLIDRKLQPNKLQVDLTRFKSDEIFLPDIFSIGSFLTKLEGTAPGQPLFSPSNLKKYQTSIKTLIRELPDGHRITESKISNFLFDLILDKTCGDVTSASLITNTPHRLSQSSLHYATPSMIDIRQLYSQAVTSAFQSIYLELGKNPPTAKETDHPPLKDIYIGSDFCPKASTIKDMVLRLKEEVSTPLSARYLKSLVRYHNVYTAYTSKMICFATGIRATSFPYIRLDDIDPETGFTVISDKDYADNYNSRLAWVPNIVQQQLKHYEMHQATILDIILVLHGPTDCPQHYMFLLKDNFSTVPLKPKNLQMVTENSFPLPQNVNRRYLRTVLQEQGCSLETINCFMGHWSRGEEPWSKHSSFSYADFAFELTNHIPKILHELGWQAKKSLISL